VGNYALPRIAAPGWQDRAGCGGADTAIFFAETPADEAAAKAICAWCPVRSDCLAFALEHNIPSGIYGGMTRDERDNHRRRARRAARRTAAA
jgi:WhiB family transcriptional regulator, redox-sensing transcriptional regulator